MCAVGVGCEFIGGKWRKIVVSGEYDGVEFQLIREGEGIAELHQWLFLEQLPSCRSLLIPVSG